MRLFLSINLPPEIKSEIGNLVRKLDSPDLKKVSVENLHLTLKFLGEVDEKMVEKIITSLGEIKFSSFKISLDKVSFFPNENHPRVIWIGVKDGRQEIISLQKEINSRLSGLGFPKEKDFQPHLTVARVRFVKNRENLLDASKCIEIGKEFRAESFDLMKSILKPGGPEYEIVRKFSSS